MGDIVFNCRHCGQQLIVEAQGIGLELPCPHCALPIVIPADATPAGSFAGPIQETPPPPPDLLDGTEDEQRTRQMLALLQEVVGDTARVEQGITSLSTGTVGAEAPPQAELAGGDALEILSDGLSLLKNKLGQMTSEVETAGQRIRDLTQLGNTLKAQISAGEADKRRLKEEISELTKTSSQRIDLGDTVLIPPQHAVLPLETTPPTPSSLPASVWGSRSFILAFAALLCLTAGAAYLFSSTHLPEVVTVVPLAEADEGILPAGREVAVGQTISFGPARVEFAAPYEDTAESALLGEVPAELRENRFLVIPVTLTNTSASQPLYLKYLWSDAELVSSSGERIKPVRLGSKSAESIDINMAQIMEPGSALAVNLVFAIPSSPMDKPVLSILPGVWSRDAEGGLVCEGRQIRLNLPPVKADPPKT